MRTTDKLPNKRIDAIATQQLQEIIEAIEIELEERSQQSMLIKSTTRQQLKEKL